MDYAKKWNDFNVIYDLKKTVVYPKGMEADTLENVLKKCGHKIVPIGERKSSTDFETMPEKKVF